MTTPTKPARYSLDEISDFIDAYDGKIHVDDRYYAIASQHDFDADLLMSCVEDNVHEDLQPESSFIDWPQVFDDYVKANHGDQDDLTKYLRM